MLRQTDASSWTDPYHSSSPAWSTARNVPMGAP